MHRFLALIGFPGSRPHKSEQTVATIGGFASIVAIMLATAALLGSQAAVAIVPSMGASAVLVFAAPHSVFAQPWSVVGGHLFSAIVGVASYRWIPRPIVRLGHFYSDDGPGQQWSVGQIIDERRSDNPQHDLVVYKVVDGDGLNSSASCTREDFARWVGSELKPRKKR